MNKVSMLEIEEYINNIEQTIGIKEYIDSKSLLHLIKQNNIKSAIEMIANYIGLPVKIKIIVTNNFTTKEIALNTFAGEQSISAQVIIPSNLPFYGTTNLINFPITVKISPKAYLYPASFAMIVSHELSHVLLYSINSSQRENEIYTDLTAMMLGFAEIYKKGRKISKGFLFPELTVYGYLNYKQFRYSINKIESKLKKRRKQISILLNLTKSTIEILDKCSTNIELFKTYLKFISEHHNMKFSPTDAQNIVGFFNPGYIDTLNIKSIKAKMSKLRNYYENKSANLSFIEKDIKEIKKLNAKAKDICRQVNLNIRILKKYIEPH